MSTFTYDNYLDLIILSDGSIEKDEMDNIYEMKDNLYSMEDNIQNLLDILSDFPGNIKDSQRAQEALDKLRHILFDIEENPDEYEYED